MAPAVNILENAVLNTLHRLIKLLEMLTYGVLVGNHDYNGSGIGVISEALKGNAVPWAFALKMLFTAITLGFGFKGGEIFPSFLSSATVVTLLQRIGMKEEKRSFRYLRSIYTERLPRLP